MRNPYDITPPPPLDLDAWEEYDKRNRSARHAYRVEAHREPDHLCDCGVPIGPRHKRCADCIKESRREYDRARHARLKGARDVA